MLATKRWMSGVLAAGAVGAFAVSSASAVVIDDYEGEVKLVAYSEEGTVSDTQAVSQTSATHPGGDRTISLTVGTEGTSATATLLENTNLFMFGTDNGGATLTVSYNNFDNADFTGGNADAFELYVPFVDGTATLQLTVDGATSSVYSIDGSASFINVAYSEFSGVDFSDVGSISYTITTEDGAPDLGIGRFSTISVPEPASIALAAMGLPLVLGFRRRR